MYSGGYQDALTRLDGLLLLDSSLQIHARRKLSRIAGQSQLTPLGGKTYRYTDFVRRLRHQSPLGRMRPPVPQIALMRLRSPQL